MIRHLFRLVWNRKRANALILLELFLSFLVLFSICTAGFYFKSNYQLPRGFDYKDVWVLDLNQPFGLMQGEKHDAGIEQFRQLMRHIRSKDPVKSAGAIEVIAYGDSNWVTYVKYKDTKCMTSFSPVGLGFDRTVALEMLEGHFFQEADLALAVPPAVINQTLARVLFGDESPLDKTLVLDDVEHKVTGVFLDYRYRGEFSPTTMVAFAPYPFDKDQDYLPSHVTMKMEPGTPLAFEAELIRELETMAPGWSFKVTTLEAMRASSFKIRISILSIFGLVAGFMLLMVAMGLVGVLWQNVTRRTAELALRRAKGATKNMIYAQILGELMVITTLAILLALIPLAQLPVLGLFESLDLGVFLSGLVAAMVIIYLITLLAGLYPSWLATTINPAEALHYE